jgi:hypothetical protein
MAIRYECDDSRRRLAITVQGPFEPAEFSAVIERRRIEGTSAYGALYDLRRMTGRPTFDDLRLFMSEAAQTNQPRGPLAIVATDPDIYSRSCTYATLVRGTVAVEVFRDLHEAEQWLTAKLNG